jgi:preprotein translocase subunit YajC
MNILLSIAIISVMYFFVMIWSRQAEKEKKDDKFPKAR